MKQSYAIVGVLCFLSTYATAEITRGVRRDEQQFNQTLTQLANDRKALFKDFKKANRQGKSRIREQARRRVIRAIVRDIIPTWLGTPWTMAVIRDGLKPNAAHPFEKGKGISCSWFIVSVLRNAGLRFVNPRHFAGTISIHLQYALTPRKRAIHRYANTSPEQLKEKMRKLGDGLYVIGLDCHVGFVYVENETVNFLHSSYTGPTEVVVEPLDRSAAIHNSESTGYVVSPIFQDVRLIDHWLLGAKVPFQKYPK
jgi:hypothetical protein